MKNYTKFLLLGFSLIAANNANASGYQLNEYSATGLGRAFAGIGVVGDDYSAISFNPAGMILKGTGGQLGLSTVQMHSFVKGTDTSNHPRLPIVRDRPYGKMNFYKFLPSGFAQYKINDKAVVGGGVYTPFGLASIYNKEWFGAGHGISTELDVVDVAFGGAYKVTNQVTLGASLIYRYVHGDILNTLPYQPDSRNRFDLDGWEFAYNFGIMYEPVKDTRIGVSYRLNTAQKVTGDHTIKRSNAMYTNGLDMNGTYPGVSKMTLPSQLLISGYHKLNDKFGLTGAVRWTKWDIFDDFVMRSPAALAVVPEKWKNTWTYSLGVDYYYSPEWTFRAGISYDPTPIRDKFHRTARIPDSNRLWTTLGVSYQAKNWQVDVGYAHLFMTKGRTYENDGYNTLKARHDNYSNMLGVQFQYNF